MLKSNKVFKDNTLSGIIQESHDKPAGGHMAG